MVHSTQLTLLNLWEKLCNVTDIDKKDFKLENMKQNFILIFYKTYI